MNDDTPKPKSGLERMLELVHRDHMALGDIHRSLLDAIRQRPRLNNDNLITAAKLIAGEIDALQIKEREIRHAQNNPTKPPSPGYSQSGDVKIPDN